MKRKDGFAPIEAYAAIGDGRTVALVAADGAVDFMSLPSLHSPTTFAAMLDPKGGGRFTLAPTSRFDASRRYVGRTNVLETTYRTGSGVVRVTEALTLQDGGLLPWVEHARRIEGLDGTVELEWRVEPRFDWGREPPQIVRRGDLLVAEGAAVRLAVHSWDAGDVRVDPGTALFGEFEIAAGERAMLALTASHEQPIHAPSRDHVEARLDATVRVWERWLGMWEYDGPWPEQVARSALALKLLIFAPEGSIAAAPTTSLPEVVGGEKNYDYRYAWVRDSAFTLDALMRLSVPEQVQQSFAWLLRAVRETAPDIRPFYSLVGGVPERRETLDHLSGYRGSRPVRYGNAASDQLQLGSWGDLIETADLYISEGNALDEDTGRLLADCVDRASVLWNDADSGIWELDELRQNTSSKMGVWMALDRAIRLAGEQLPDEHTPRWREARDRLHAWIEANCWSEELGSYRGWAGEEKLDASVLRALRMGYPEPERLARTVDAIRRGLDAGPGLLYRTSDHIGQEGAFVACSFWLVEALARLGRVDEACEEMETVLARANDVGLLSEEIDPESGAFLGNFPQGLSHLALISAAGAIQEAATG